MVDERLERVLAVFETHWDRKQLDACRPAWVERAEVVFPPPNDCDCPSGFDVFGMIDDAAAGRLGRVDGVLSSSDYPGATVAAAIATRLGLPGPRPEHVIGASHKYYSRIAQRRVAPEVVPDFALVDPNAPPATPPLPLPFFIKPVKSSFSVLARRIETMEALRALLASPAVSEFTSEYMILFDRLVETFTSFEVDGGYLLAEELVGGQLATVEGFVCDGEVELLGIVDSQVHEGGSFARFDYPSALPAAVQARMADVASRVIGELGLERSLFNVEMTWSPEADRVSIIEVNPRICGQFADLYQKVDGTNAYEVALALCLGGRPRPARGAGPDRAAASFPLRVFAPARVVEAPGAERLAEAEARFARTLVWSECAAGDDLCDFDVDEDGASHRYAVVNVGGDDRDDLADRAAEIGAILGYRMAPL